MRCWLLAVGWWLFTGENLKDVKREDVGVDLDLDLDLDLNLNLDLDLDYSLITIHYSLFTNH